jgi:hypothetical protein
MEEGQDQGQRVAINPADLPLVTFDNNVLIAMENGEPAAPFVELLLRFNHQLPPVLRSVVLSSPARYRRLQARVSLRAKHGTIRRYASS